MLVWTEIEITFLTAGSMGLYLGFLLEIVVVTEGFSPYFLHKTPCASRACTTSMFFLLLILSPALGSVWLA